jgi:hypothetical protein
MHAAVVAATAPHRLQIHCIACALCYLQTSVCVVQAAQAFKALLSFLRMAAVCVYYAVWSRASCDHMQFRAATLCVTLHCVCVALVPFCTQSGVYTLACCFSRCLFVYVFSHWLVLRCEEL